MRGAGLHRHFVNRIAFGSITTVASTSYRTRREPAKRPSFVKCEITSTVGAMARTASSRAFCSFGLSSVHACTESITATAASGGTAANASRQRSGGVPGLWSACCPMRRTRCVGDWVRAKRASTSARSCSASSQYANPSRRSAIRAASSAHTVDFPAPGSPPTAIFRPGTTPPIAWERTQPKSIGWSGRAPWMDSTRTPGGGSCSIRCQTVEPHTQTPLETSGR